MDPRTPTDPILPVVTQPNARSERRREFAAMLTSSLLHVALIICLAMWVLPSLSRGRRFLEVAVDNNQLLALETIDVSTELSEDFSEASDTPTRVPDAFDFASLELAAATVTSNVGNELVTNSLAPVDSPLDAMTTSDSVEGAVERIIVELNEKLEKDDLLVVWLSDASNSLVDDRQRVASRLTPFYEQLASKRSTLQHQLLSTVVSFGRSMNERVAPTEFGEKIVRAVGKLPVDRTGKEQVFDAVTKCSAHYRNSWDGQIAIVIWTDESGDDLDQLEPAIESCRRHRVSVSVVGPSSVLGAETGLHSYTDPQTDSVYQVPVRRGPETPMSERIELGYWYLTWVGRGGPVSRRGGGQRNRAGQGGDPPSDGSSVSDPPQPRRGNGGPQFGRPLRRGLPAWLGGQDLEGILSGFSPYALTRLTMQTGGSYTIFDRPEDRGPFDPMAMKRYAPDYGSYARYKEEIESNPLRRAILNAVGELKGKKIDAPPTMLFIKSTGPRVFDFVRYYYPPAEFQAKLRGTRGRLVGQAARYAKVVDAALRHLSSDESLARGLEDLHQYETSPRWRAWYQLTRGRLLAVSVRLEEYRLTVNAIAKPGGLAPSTNHVRLVHSTQLRSDSSYQARAEEAERLLKLCLSEHRDTPWEMLARRELDYHLGIDVLQRALTPGPIQLEIRAPRLPRF